MQRSNFLEYEKKHNRFLKELRSKENQNIVSLIIEHNATILCPHDQSVEQTFENFKLQPVTPRPSSNSIIPLVFLQTHVVYTNSLQFLSLNGVRGTFSDKFDKINVLAGPPTGDDCMTFFTEPLSFFTKGYVLSILFYVLTLFAFYLQTFFC